MVPAPAGACSSTPRSFASKVLPHAKATLLRDANLLTGGILDVALESRIHNIAGSRLLNWPRSTISPSRFGFIRTPLTSPEPNRL